MIRCSRALARNRGCIISEYEGTILHAKTGSISLQTLISYQQVKLEVGGIFRDLRSEILPRYDLFAVDEVPVSAVGFIASVGGAARKNIQFSRKNILGQELPGVMLAPGQVFVDGKLRLPPCISGPA